MSSFVPTSAEIAQARADLAGLLPDTCTIQQATVTSDGGGGQTRSWTDLATDVACRLSPAVAPASSSRSTGTALIGDRLEPTTTHIITLTAGTTIATGDRVIIGATTFEVLVVADGGAWELARHVQARKATV